MSNTAASGRDWLETVVVTKTREAEDVARLVLAAPDGAPLPAFEAGAHVEIALPNGLVRPYSLCNDPFEADHWEIAVLLDRNGRGGSRAVHEQIAEGGSLKVRAPRNFFPLAGDGHALLLAGGIGVTPLLAMAETLVRSGRPFDLHVCSRTEDRAAFRDRLAEPRFAGHVHRHFDEGPREQAFDARAVLAAAPSDSRLHVCGPRGFMDHVLSTARALGWPEERLHWESFSAAPIEAGDDASFRLVLARSNLTIDVPAGTSAAAAMSAAGVEPPLSCEQGICGTCLLPVIEGLPDHRDHVQTAAERAENRFFAPCCSRALTERLVLDF